MIRKSALNHLRYDFLIPLLKEHLEPLGFRYVKSAAGFIRNNGALNEKIRVFTDARQPLHFDERTDTLYLRFQLSAELTSPKLEKWLKEKIGRGNFRRRTGEALLGQVAVDMGRFSESDFYEPGQAQEFKNRVYASLRRPDRETYLTFGEVVEKIPKMVDELRACADPVQLFESWQGHNYWQHVYLLIFTGHAERARAEYQTRLDAATDALAGDLPAEQRKELLAALTNWQREIKIFFAEDIGKRHTAEVRITENQSMRLRLASELAYAEQLRLDVSLTGAISHYLSPSGEVTILGDDLLIRRFSPNGTLLLKHQITLTPGRVNPYWKNAAFKVLRGGRAISINNLVLTADNRVIELPGEAEKEQGTAQPFFRISGLAPTLDDAGYVMLYSTYNKRCKLSRYDAAGGLLETTLIGEHPVALHPQRGEIITWATSLGKAVYGFDGRLKYRFKCEDDKVVFSPDGALAFFYGYHTKSTLLDLASGDTTPVWGHPTYLKNYAATFYGDIENNFGIDTAAFTPDGKHLIGGAYHGKYAVWDTDQWERRELIPSPEHRRRLATKLSTVFTNGTKQEYGFIPYVQKHAGHEIYVSRSNGLRSVHFVDDGKYTVGQVGNKLLCWDAAFNDTGLVNVGGNAVLNSGFALLRAKSELVLFSRLDGVASDFKSSDFVMVTDPPVPPDARGRWLISEE